MRGIARRFAVAATAVLTMAGGVTFATAGQAMAGGWGCTGSEVSGSPYPVASISNGAVYSYVHLFYDSSTGWNCAVNVKTGSLYGTPTYVHVALEQCAEDTPGTCTGWTVNDPTDSSVYYSYYAGPVSVPGQGHCVALEADTNSASGDKAYYSSYGGYHC